MKRLLLVLAALFVVIIPAAVVVLGSTPIPVACAPLPALTTGDGSGPVPVSNPGARLDVRVATWNTYAYNSTAQISAGIRAIGADADVIGLQEFNPESRRKQVARALADTWAVSRGNNSVQIFWQKSRFQLLAEGSEQVFGLERIEAGVSGTSIGPKSIQWVQLRDAQTGAVFFVANHHIVPSVDRRGLPDVRNPRRLELYRQQMAAMLGVVGKLRPYGPVMVTGDFNVDARRDALNQDPTFPYVLTSQAGLASNWRALGDPGGGTQGARLIDYVFATTDTASFAAQRILPKYGSDHAAVAVAVTNQQVGAGSASTNLNPSALPNRIEAAGTRLQGDQISNAATIIAEGKAAGIPPQGWTVALAAALQESGLKALGSGDRDSEGIFQQRPSTGWGTPEQVRDPRLATQAFYGVASHTANLGLTDVPGWQGMSVAAAAQAVQKSAFPSAYARWEAAARAIVQRLAGSVTPGGLGPLAGSADCGPNALGVDGGCPPTGLVAETGLMPDASLVLRCAKEQFPGVQTFYGIGDRPAASDSDHPSGRAVDLMIPDYKSVEGAAYGWQIARWARLNARALGVKYVIFAAKIWNADRDAEGWRDYGNPAGSSDDSALHHDHVHVSVYGNAGTGPTDQQANLTPGQWAMPLPAGSYRVGCAYGCYGGHAGQDFPVATGTNLVSSTDGRVVKSEALTTGDGGYRSYGNLIVIAVAGRPDVTVWYAHLSRRDVAVGDTVRAGQTIGLTGNTGNSTGPHLHYEIRVGGSPTDPMAFLRLNGVEP